MKLNDERIIMTLDAGGTNFVFSAIQNYEIITPLVTLPAYSSDLDACLAQIVEGFRTIESMIAEVPVAISFAFPGPADYENGIIGDLPNFKAFRGGVALGPYLKDMFNIPVFINNDGKLFAYGEANYGVLPRVNKLLLEHHGHKQYNHLLGVTLGTGFGAGIVVHNSLVFGDNGCAGDIWNLRNKKYPDLIVEESVSIRAITHVYQVLSGEDISKLEPKDIFEIAEGIKKGSQVAAIRSFEEFGEMAGDAIGMMLNAVDGIVVVGGGIASAAKYFMPSLIQELKRNIRIRNGAEFQRVQAEVYNLDDSKDMKLFLGSSAKEIHIPYSKKTVFYDESKKVGVLISTLGANQAIMCGAYAYAINQLDK